MEKMWNYENKNWNFGSKKMKNCHLWNVLRRKQVLGRGWQITFENPGFFFCEIFLIFKLKREKCDKILLKTFKLFDKFTRLTDSHFLLNFKHSCVFAYWFKVFVIIKQKFFHGKCVLIFNFKLLIYSDLCSFLINQSVWCGCECPE